MRPLMPSLIALFCIALGGHALAGAQADSVTLKPSPPLMKDADALPRLLSGAPPAVVKTINATLAQVDAQALRDAKDCLRAKGSDYGRGVSATMQGSGFLSLVVNQSFSCAGAAHPDSETQALVFDLTTGKFVDWEKLLPGAVQIKKIDADLEKKFPFHATVASDAIWALYKKEALKENSDPDCADAFDDKLDFVLSLDAGKNALAVDEVGLRHAVEACGITLYLSGDALKSLGAGKELIDALDAAHRRPGGG